MHGTLTLLFDADEHTGAFGGAKRYFDAHDSPTDIAGVMIGYPGIDELVVGGRGFLRADITVHGQAGHTGSRRSSSNANAIEKAAQLVSVLAKHRNPGPIDPALDLPPRLTVTGIDGGESYSINPDYCTVKVDIRLTTDFTATTARTLLDTAVADVDNTWCSPTRPSTLAFRETWPAYRLREDAAICDALMQATKRHLADNVAAKVAGPSNIGNYLARLGIDATAGLGVNYEGLHGTDERIELATVSPIQAVYHEAIQTLLCR